MQRPDPLDPCGNDGRVVRMRATVHCLPCTGSGSLVGGEQDEVAGTVLDMETGEMQPDQKATDLRSPTDRDGDQMVLLMMAWHRR